MREMVKDAGAEVRDRVRGMVEAIVERVRMLFAWLTGGEYVPPALASRAAATIAKAVQEDAAVADDDLPVRRMPIPLPSLGERVRRAADCMRHDRAIGKNLLNPADPEEAKILEWLKRYKLEALDAIASTPAFALQMHVTGCRRHPGLPGMNEPKKGVPLDGLEWAAWLQRFERERGNQEPCPERIRLMAIALEERNFSVEELITQARRGRGASDAA
ncbi:hypothetical protein SAMN06297251_10467 [Fulvimarina manganoxydans]|uniref:Uncharacterized protein n=1 Tax=Fulvimarina manganoxydans TaxID=937218 RepID=A0A1W2AC73_9HYPH|nr:hypothetical protein [Fulvimarina manganoxydans]SMC58325.1 hypothetical protein SAMN06297251_10467 [Fulvimarina manganoxydans]